MKKITILLTTILIVSIALMSFKTKTVTRYGGTASIRVKVTDCSSIDCNMAKRLDNVKAGDTRVINVETSCTYSNKADAQEALAQKIKFEKRIYEKDDSSIAYEMTICD